MIDPPLLRPRTALLSIDFQNDVGSAGGLMAPEEPSAQERFERAIDRAHSALSTARALGLFIVHVRVAFGDGHPGVNLFTPMGQALHHTNALLEGTPGSDFIRDVAPTGNELVITKRMVSAFEGTELDQQLRARDINTVVTMGLVTHLAVEGTVRSAADRGYRVVTLGDCCASGDGERHRAALDVLELLGPVIQASSLAASMTSTAS